MSAAVFTIHSILRYAVLVVGVAAVIAAVLAWRRQPAPAGGADRTVLAAFAGLLDLQVVVGIVLLIVRGFYPALIGHLVMMVAAVAVAHIGSVRARRVAPGPGTARIRLITAVTALLLIVGGVMAIGRPII